MSQDVPVMTSYLSRINSQLEKVREHAEKLKEYVHTLKFGAKEGVDLLELKNQLVLRLVADDLVRINLVSGLRLSSSLSYMIGLSNVMLAKTSGGRTMSLSQHQAVDRLVEVRTVRPEALLCVIT